ncbi:MAG: TerB N-terminal domain-containing protein [Longimicrobiales bacterium]
MLWFILIVVGIALLATWAIDVNELKSKRGMRTVSNRSSRPESRELSNGQRFAQSQRAWVSPGELARVWDLEIPGGMVYIGEEMAAFSRWQGVDPALINPRLEVSAGGLTRVLGYWPSYSEIQPGQRRVYLEWLAGGRRDPDIPLGYVFLFFYGLERRVLADYSLDPKSVHPDLEPIREELKALLEIHRGDSFQQYGNSLLQLLEIRLGELEDATPPTENPHWDLPAKVKVCIGQMIQEGRAIPPEWAHSWVVCDRETGLRTPALRCAGEFDALFRIRYAEKFGEGMKVREPKTRLTIKHGTASRGVPDEFGMFEVDLPDITSITGPQKKLREIADQVQDELDSYSRHVGRNNDRSSVEAQALLPAELVGTRQDDDTDALRTLLQESARESGEVGRVRVRDLAELYPTKTPGKIYKDEARKICDLVRKLGFGIEPDTARGGPNIGQSEVVSVFRLPEGKQGAEAAWSETATLLLRLGSAVAASDESITEDEERDLERHLEEMMDLTEPQRLRFRAHLRWSLTHPISMRGVRAKARSLSDSDKAKVAHAMLGVAGADGKIDRSEMKTLTRIYEVLGFSEHDLYSDLHELASGDLGPVTVKDADDTPEYEIERPENKGKAKKPAGTIALDREKIARISRESESASALLAGVFQEAEDQGEEPEAPGAELSAFGFDEAHEGIFQEIITRDRWSEEELSDLVEKHGLFVGGVVEVINEAAFEICGEPLIEPGDGWELNEYAAEEMKT